MRQVANHVLSKPDSPTNLLPGWSSRARLDLLRFQLVMVIPLIGTCRLKILWWEQGGRAACVQDLT